MRGDPQPPLIPDVAWPEGGPPDDAIGETSTGILPSQMLEEAIQAGWIVAESGIGAEQVQPASLDLRLGPVAYRVRASFLPGRRPVMERLEELRTHELDLSAPTVLEKGCVYIVPLVERLQLPSNVSAKANPKSSTGRLDVFTRVIADFNGEFDRIRPGYRGRLYVEVVPQTFGIVVRTGTELTQLRLVRGSSAASDALVEALHDREALVFGESEAASPVISRGLWLSVDLRGPDRPEIVGYRAKAHAPLIDLDKVGCYDPWDFWEPIERPRNGQLFLNPEDFYVLCSKERIRVPFTVAAEMVSYEPSVGEFRNHYAGFFDPGFGCRNDDIQGTHAVLEVRSHEVPFVLEDGQLVSRLEFQRLVSEARKTYGPEIGSSYQDQRVSLSKHFKPWSQSTYG